MDEYDSLPDPFEGIDFDQIPALCHRPPDSSQDYDSYFDELDPRELDRIPHLGPAAAHDLAPHALPAEEPRQPPPNAAGAMDGAQDLDINAGQPHDNTQAISVPESQAPSSVAAPSTQYTFDDIDDTFLNEVTIVEQEVANNHIPATNHLDAVAQNIAATQTRRRSSTIEFFGRRASRSSFKRKRSDVSSAPTTPSKRKRLSRVKSSKEELVDLNASARSVLASMEPEFTCPICLELLVVAYCANPCGHSCCGECLMQWVKVMRLARAHNPDPSQEVSLPQCPICRTELNEQRPMIPNIRMDNAVQTHISLSAKFGRVDWEPTGKRYLDFVKRKEQTVTLPQRIAQLQDIVPPVPKPPTNHALDWVDEMYSEVENLSSEE